MPNMRIADGAGSGKEASVTSDNRLDVSSRANPRIYYVSRDDGQAYSVSSNDASAAAGTYILYLKNTSTTRNLFVDDIILGGVETALWKIWFVTGTAAGGNAKTPVNLNKTSPNAADATARGDDSITGLTVSGEQIGTLRTPANDSKELATSDAIELGQNDAIAIEYDTGTTGIAEAEIVFYYE
jgi:hypothetical protein